MKLDMMKTTAATVALAALLLVGCSDTNMTNDSLSYDDRQPVTQTVPGPDLRDRQPMQTEKAGDLELDNAQVAKVSNATLQNWMSEAQQTLQERRDAATTDIEKEHLEEISDKAEEVSEELASLDADEISEPADEELVKEVLEVQLEVDDMTSSEVDI